VLPLAYPQSHPHDNQDSGIGWNSAAGVWGLEANRWQAHISILCPLHLLLLSTSKILRKKLWPLWLGSSVMTTNSCMDIF
jgi:hypothetical protein